MQMKEMLHRKRRVKNLRKMRTVFETKTEIETETGTTETETDDDGGEEFNR